MQGLRHLALIRSGHSPKAKRPPPLQSKRRPCPGLSSSRQIPPLPLATAVPITNLHAQPSHDTEVISQSIYGFPLTCLDTAGDWIQVCAADNYPGWALSQHFLPRPTSPTPCVRVHQLSANLYRTPDIKARAPLLHLPWEARLEPLPNPQQTSDRWLQVRLLNGQTAFVLRGDLTPELPPLTLEATLALAQRFLGITYTWGGISTFGFDCSGLMQTLHRQRGIVLPRDAHAQCHWPGFTAVPRTALLPGDLLFFTDNPPAITHVGLFLGAGTFLHSTTEGHPGVQISLLADHPWHTRLCAQRRLRP